MRLKKATTLVHALLLLAAALPTPARAQTGPRLATSGAEGSAAARPVTANIADETAAREHAHTFGPLSDRAFLAWLAAAQYPTAPPEPARRRWTESYVKDTNLPVVAGGDDLHSLSRRAAPALKLFGREGVYTFVVFRDDTPFIQSVTAACIGISTGMLALLDGDDELNGMVAHELAHEHDDRAYAAAAARGDLAAMRASELGYDAIAARALSALGMDPLALGRALSKIIGPGSTAAHFNNGTGTHPSLATRLGLNEEMARLVARPAAVYTAAAGGEKKR